MFVAVIKPMFPTLWCWEMAVLFVFLARCCFVFGTTIALLG
jgi:hypothetical protein